MTDPRIERTRTRLRAAALDLAERDALDRLTVSHLAAVAGVSRATFYGHYRSIDEIFAEALSADLDELRREEAELRRRGDIAGDAIVHACIAGVARHVDRFEAVYRHALDATAGSVVWHSMREHFAESIRRILARQPTLPAHIDPDIAAAFGASALTGAIEAWLRDDGATLDTLIDTVERSLPEWWRTWQ